MKKIFYVAFISSLILFGITYVSANDLFQVSDKKISEINTVIDSETTMNDITETAVQNNILEQIEAKFPVNSKTPLVELTDFEIAKEMSIITQKQFPDSIESQKEKLKEEAKKLYYDAKHGDTITLEYSVGNNIYEVKGEYKGLNRQGNGINVDHRVIPIFDLLPKYKTLFNKQLRNQKREEYVRAKLNMYIVTRMSFNDEQVDTAKENIINSNENAGYIYVNYKWLKPVDYANSIILEKVRKAEGGEDILSSTDNPTLNELDFSSEKNITFDTGTSFNEFQDEEISFEDIELPEIPKRAMYTISAILIVQLILSLVCFICFILILIKMFKAHKIGFGIVCIILTFIIGIGSLLAFIYGWVKSSEIRSKRIMKLWTICIIVNIVLTIIVITEFFNVILTIIEKANIG